MTIDKIIRPRNLLLVLVLAGIILAGYQAFVASKPSAEITINGSHDPINNYVFVNGVRAYPEGEGGKVYKPELTNGENKVSITGPYIKTAEASLDASPFGKYTSDISVENVSTQEIIRQTTKESAAKINLLRSFDDDNVLVFRLDTQLSVDRKINSRIIRYDSTAREWLDITTSFIDNPELYQIDENAKNYLFELLGD